MLLKHYIRNNILYFIPELFFFSFFHYCSFPAMYTNTQLRRTVRSASQRPKAMGNKVPCPKTQQSDASQSIYHHVFLAPFGTRTRASGNMQMLNPALLPLRHHASPNIYLASYGFVQCTRYVHSPSFQHHINSFKPQPSSPAFYKHLVILFQESKT